MGLFKWLCSRFSCTSSCKFNNQMFDSSKLALPLEEFELKMKDVKRILKILNKRGTISVPVNNCSGTII